MLESLPLRSRLSLLLGAVLALGLALGVALLMLHAGARIHAEAEAATRLGQDFVASDLARAQTSPDPQAELVRLLAEARKFRHLRIFIEGDEPPALAGNTGRAPVWFTALTLPRASVTRVELTGRLHGAALLIVANPADEIAEIWEEIVALALGGALVAAAAFVLVFVAVTRTLAPVSALAGGLARLEQGDHSLRVSRSGSPEFVVIADRINALAATLERLDDENHQLLRRMIHVQEEERRDIARDLHDEIGPFLFAIRAGVGALRRKTANAALEQDCAKIDAQIAALQQVNRSILARLRPAALEEMGLAGALEALAQGWRDSDPAVAIDLEVCAFELDEKIALVAFRIVQEGLTNAFRHSGAGHVSIKVACAISSAPRELYIRIKDDGAGLAVGWRAGLGLRGMSERLAAFGGMLTLKNREAKGAALEARLPVTPAIAAQ
jgi:two-component system sensor histidine kinase UhpB